MALNREKLFPDAHQRELQDAVEELLVATEKLVYATRLRPLNTMRCLVLATEAGDKQVAFNNLLRKVL